ncbi:hypothetical protein KCTC32516_01880 [Polaribacter huanghezhanensis]|uniref:glycosyltransferase family A protein n=1 Tax=Polaribacter huanghezhanensis TaxID=1354726 RepID=UPI0026475F15|nr:glycosyltransferase family A protein [Polaribacter huanghezhanensis]WKD86504.1 hypothetical protein KCTC32516_01880 [Polaribacter huanghezhanensis]
MRIGTNPEKEKSNRIHYKKHRVLIPVYIPKDKDPYFKDLFDVFKESMNSLLLTISSNNTAITIINNNCKVEVTDFIDKLLVDKKIDKHVKLVSNYGKVYTVLSEARASFEDYITIADADVFYFNHWEKEVFELFSVFKKVGVVSPVPAPHLALYNNVSLFGSLYRKPKMKNVVDSESFLLFEQGTNNTKIFNNRNYNWKEKQYYLEKKGVKACVGSGHFIATYKNVFKFFPLIKPEFVFKQADENEFIDSQFDKLGYYRVSTLKAFAYHLGNTIPDWIRKYRFSKKIIFLTHIKQLKRNKLTYLIKKLLFKVLKKFKII